MAFVEGTGGPVNGTGWKNQNKTQGSASTGGSGSGSGASYDLSWLRRNRPGGPPPSKPMSAAWRPSTPPTTVRSKR